MGHHTFGSMRWLRCSCICISEGGELGLSIGKLVEPPWGERVQEEIWKEREKNEMLLTSAFVPAHLSSGHRHVAAARDNIGRRPTRK